MASGHSVNWVFLVGVHLEQLSDSLLAALGGVDDLSTRLNRTGVNADISQSTEEWVAHHLECQSSKWLLWIWLTSQTLFFVTWVTTLNTLNI